MTVAILSATIPLVYSFDLKRQWLHVWYFQLWQWAGLCVCVTKYCFFSLYFRDLLLVMLSFCWVFLGCGFATDKDWADGKDLTASPSLVPPFPALCCCRGSCRSCMIRGSNVAPPPWQPTVRSYCVIVLHAESAPAQCIAFHSQLSQWRDSVTAAALG